MKYVELIFESEVWRIPLNIIAKHRAKYYSVKEGEQVYQTEFDYIMKDDDEGIDWLQNNMDLKDFSDTLIKIKNETNIDWRNSDDASICEIK